MFDPERVVAFPSLSPASGAVKGWDRRNAYTFSMLESVARHYGFDLDTPFEQLAPEHRQLLLHGSGEEPIAFTYAAEGAGGRKRSVSRLASWQRVLTRSGFTGTGQADHGLASGECTGRAVRSSSM